MPVTKRAAPGLQTGQLHCGKCFIWSPLSSDIDPPVCAHRAHRGLTRPTETGGRSPGFLQKSPAPAALGQLAQRLPLLDGGCGGQDLVICRQGTGAIQASAYRYIKGHAMRGRHTHLQTTGQARECLPAHTGCLLSQPCIGSRLKLDRNLTKLRSTM